MPSIVIHLEERQPLYDAYGYAPAVLNEGLLFVSGQVGVDARGAAIADPKAQAEQVFANLGDVLAAAGCSVGDILDITSFHVDMHRHFEAFAAAKQKAFPTPPYPAWTAIGVQTLADPALLFEVKAVVRVP